VDTFIAGLLGGYVVFGERTAVNEQVSVWQEVSTWFDVLTEMSVITADCALRCSSRRRLFHS
jgi:hypothetical protein